MSKNKCKNTFFARSSKAIAEPGLTEKITKATSGRFDKQQEICGEEFPDRQRMRDLVMNMRNDVLKNLDRYLVQLTDNLTAAGVSVHFAEDASAARELIHAIAEKNNISRIVKSKSMVSEEIELNDFLESKGLTVTETDLGEFIIQQAHQKPSHLICPAVHLNKEEIAKLFRDKLSYDGPTDPTVMTKFARKILREEFRQAEMGISGVNFAVADPGLLTICTNEGNGRYITTRPRVYVALMGMERIVPDLASAAVMIKTLTRHATGQRITQYTSFAHGPSDKDGPKEVHLVILDNGRSEILKSPYWPALRCIRCGACLNACPVFRKIGGHAWGGAYSGPIGTMILPLLFGQDSYPDLVKGSSLCGLCAEVCPAQIPTPDILTGLRYDQVRQKKTSLFERLMMNVWSIGLRHPKLYKIGQWWMPKILKPVSKNGWVKFLPGPPGGWTRVKDLPLPAKQSFQASLKKSEGR
jgi:L-lactate dehydrogenase complex protein LldF